MQHPWGCNGLREATPHSASKPDKCSARSKHPSCPSSRSREYTLPTHHFMSQQGTPRQFLTSKQRRHDGDDGDSCQRSARGACGSGTAPDGCRGGGSVIGTHRHRGAAVGRVGMHHLAGTVPALVGGSRAQPHGGTASGALLQNSLIRDGTTQSEAGSACVAGGWQLARAAHLYAVGQMAATVRLALHARLEHCAGVTTRATVFALLSRGLQQHKPKHKP
jgi:hypothetical protein